MNRIASCCFIASLAIPLIGQVPANSDKNLRNQIMISAIDSKLNAMPLERWKTALLPPSPRYPGLSQIAGIEGELLMHCKVGPNGRVTDTRLVSGPAQLASTLDKWVRLLQFKPLPEDGSGPWHFPVSAKFSLPDRIQLFPSAIKILPTAPEQDGVKK